MPSSDLPSLKRDNHRSQPAKCDCKLVKQRQDDELISSEERFADSWHDAHSPSVSWYEKTRTGHTSRGSCLFSLRIPVISNHLRAKSFTFAQLAGLVCPRTTAEIDFTTPSVMIIGARKGEKQVIWTQKARRKNILCTDVHSMSLA